MSCEPKFGSFEQTDYAGQEDPGRTLVIRRKDGSEWTFVVSSVDHDLVVANGPWCVMLVRGKRPYAVRNVRGVDGKRRLQYLHNFLLGFKGVDHISNDSLDNRRSNLRPCSPSENQLNRPANKNNRSGRKGVVWHSRSGRWMASLKVEGRAYYLGYFDSVESAAFAHEGFARIMHGDFFRSE
jgi:hypothetical protein